MSKKSNSDILIPTEHIASRIMVMRKEKIMLDFHLAELYGIETRALKQAVKRNLEKFPSDFMFQLTADEINNLLSQNVIPSKKHLGGAIPYAFTEPGVAMLSSILKTQTAVKVNIAIMRTFVKLREHDDKILLIFEYLKQFEQSKIQELKQQNRPKIGFKQIIK